MTPTPPRRTGSRPPADHASLQPRARRESPRHRPPGASRLARRHRSPLRVRLLATSARLRASSRPQRRHSPARPGRRAASQRHRPRGRRGRSPRKPRRAPGRRIRRRATVIRPLPRLRCRPAQDRPLLSRRTRPPAPRPPSLPPPSLPAAPKPESPVAHPARRSVLSGRRVLALGAGLALAAGAAGWLVGGSAPDTAGAERDRAANARAEAATAAVRATQRLARQGRPRSPGWTRAAPPAAGACALRAPAGARRLRARQLAGAFGAHGGQPARTTRELRGRRRPGARPAARRARLPLAGRGGSSGRGFRSASARGGSRRERPQSRDRRARRRPARRLSPAAPSPPGRRHPAAPRPAPPWPWSPSAGAPRSRAPTSRASRAPSSSASGTTTAAPERSMWRAFRRLVVRGRVRVGNQDRGQPCCGHLQHRSPRPGGHQVGRRQRVGEGLDVGVEVVVGRRADGRQALHELGVVAPPAGVQHRARRGLPEGLECGEVQPPRAQRAAEHQHARLVLGDAEAQRGPPRGRRRPSRRAPAARPPRTCRRRGPRSERPGTPAGPAAPAAGWSRPGGCRPR